MGCEACRRGSGVHVCQRYVSHPAAQQAEWKAAQKQYVGVQRTHLTFAEAMEAVKEGKKVRQAGWIAGVYVHIEYGEARMFSTGDSSHGPFNVTIDRLHATDWHITEDKPAKSRIQEMAEVEDKRVPGMTAQIYERIAREVVEAVAKWASEADSGWTAVDIRAAFLEPRK